MEEGGGVCVCRAGWVRGGRVGGENTAYTVGDDNSDKEKCL